MLMAVNEAMVVSNPRTLKESGISMAPSSPHSTASTSSFPLKMSIPLGCVSPPGCALSHHMNSWGSLWSPLYNSTVLQADDPTLLPLPSQWEHCVFTVISCRLPWNMITLRTSWILNFRSNLSLSKSVSLITII